MVRFKKTKITNPVLVTEKICSKFPNKTRYNSLKQANFAISRIKNAKMTVYYCEVCLGYHLTTIK